MSLKTFQFLLATALLAIGATVVKAQDLLVTNQGDSIKGRG